MLLEHRVETVEGLLVARGKADAHVIVSAIELEDHQVVPPVAIYVSNVHIRIGEVRPEIDGPLGGYGGARQLQKRCGIGAEGSIDARH